MYLSGWWYLFSTKFTPLTVFSRAPCSKVPLKILLLCPLLFLSTFPGVSLFRQSSYAVGITYTLQTYLILDTWWMRRVLFKCPYLSNGGPDDSWRRYWLCIDNLLCKPIPMTHHSVTEKYFLESRRHLLTESLTVSSKIISSVAKFKKMLLIDLLYICKYLEGLSEISIDSSSLKRRQSKSLQSRLVGTILVAVLWTLSRICISFTRWGDHAWTQYSIWGRM